MFVCLFVYLFAHLCILEKCSLGLYVYRTFTMVLRLYAYGPDLCENRHIFAVHDTPGSDFWLVCHANLV